MSNHERPLADHVQPQVDEARLARQWSAIASRLERPRPSRVRWAVLAAVAMLVVVSAGLLARRWRSDAAAPVVAQANGGKAESSFALPDGSRVLLAPNAHASLASASIDRVELVVEAGRVDFDVTHVEGRPFVVRARAYEVVVVGTRFSVTIDEGARVTVAVEKGRVKIRGSSGDERFLSAGETWSGSEIAPQPPEPPAPASAPPAESASTSPSPPVPASNGATATAPAASVDTPKQLFARAMTARAEGRSRDAAALFDTLRKKHRSDPRAGLAAFELGRIRLDSLGDAEGAAAAFTDALALAPDGPFREDAEARLVEAFERTGDRSRCARAKASYQSHHPNGLHGKQVANRCNAL